jgi:hypothetical protein
MTSVRMTKNNYMSLSKITKKIKYFKKSNNVSYRRINELTELKSDSNSFIDATIIQLIRLYHILIRSIKKSVEQLLKLKETNIISEKKIYIICVNNSKKFHSAH